MFAADQTVHAGLERTIVHRQLQHKNDGRGHQVPWSFCRRFNSRHTMMLSTVCGHHCVPATFFAPSRTQHKKLCLLDQTATWTSATSANIKPQLIIPESSVPAPFSHSKQRAQDTHDDTLTKSTDHACRPVIYQPAQACLPHIVSTAVVCITFVAIVIIGYSTPKARLLPTSGQKRATSLLPRTSIIFHVYW